MTDTSALAALLQDYARHFDARDPVAFSELFTDDAIVSPPFGDDLVGRAEIESMVARTPAGGAHEVGDPVVVETADDRVTTRTDYTAQMRNGKRITGWYDDTFRLTAEGWRIERHRISVH